MTADLQSRTPPGDGEEGMGEEVEELMWEEVMWEEVEEVSHRDQH